MALWPCSNSALTGLLTVSRGSSQRRWYHGANLPEFAFAGAISTTMLPIYLDIVAHHHRLVFLKTQQSLGVTHRTVVAHGSDLVQMAFVRYDLRRVCSSAVSLGLMTRCLVCFHGEVSNTHPPLQANTPGIRGQPSIGSSWTLCNESRRNISV